MGPRLYWGGLVDRASIASTSPSTVSLLRCGRNCPLPPPWVFSCLVQNASAVTAGGQGPCAQVIITHQYHSLAPQVPCLYCGLASLRLWPHPLCLIFFGDGTETEVRVGPSTSPTRSPLRVSLLQRVRASIIARQPSVLPWFRGGGPAHHVQLVSVTGLCQR